MYAHAQKEITIIKDRITGKVVNKIVKYCTHQTESPLKHKHLREKYAKKLEKIASKRVKK